MEYMVELSPADLIPPVFLPIGVWVRDSKRVIVKFLDIPFAKDKEMGYKRALANFRNPSGEDLFDLVVDGANPYSRMYREPVKTDAFQTLEECADSVLKDIVKERGPLLIQLAQDTAEQEE